MPLRQSSHRQQTAAHAAHATQKAMQSISMHAVELHHDVTMDDSEPRCDCDVRIVSVTMRAKACNNWNYLSRQDHVSGGLVDKAGAGAHSHTHTC